MKAEYHVVCALIALTNLYRCLYLSGSTDEDGDDDGSNDDACSFAMHVQNVEWLAESENKCSVAQRKYAREFGVKTVLQLPSSCLNASPFIPLVLMAFGSFSVWSLIDFWL